MSGSGKPYHEETWFEAAFIVACLGVGYLLFRGFMPDVNLGNDSIETIAMAKLMAEGRIMDAFARFNLPPIYPALLALVIKIKHTTELPRLIDAFHILNLVCYYLSIGLVHYFVRRQIPKPYTFIITGLYVLAPATLGMVWSISPQMTYMVMSLGALLAIDISLSKESAMGGELSRGEIIWCGSFLALSILTWQVGYTLLVAFFFVTLKRFKLKKSAVLLTGIILSISPFIGRDIFYVMRSPHTYFGPTVSIVRTMTSEGVFRTLETHADRIITNVTQNTMGDLNLASLDRFAHTPRRSGPDRIGLAQRVWVRWAISLIAITGAVYGLYVYTGIGTLYLCTYVITALALVPSTGWTLAPVIPLLLFYLYFGLLRTGQWFQRLDMPMLTRVTVPILTAWILLATLTSYLSMAGAAITKGSSHAPKVMYMSTSKESDNRLEKAQTGSAHRRAMDWLEAHTGPDAKVAVPKPGALSRLTDEKGKSKADESAKQHLKEELGHYDYLVEEGAAKISPAKADVGHGLKLVYEDVAGRIRIWQVKSAP